MEKNRRSFLGMMRPVVFLSGPMRGLPDLGRKAFHEAAAWLDGEYFCKVLNPAILPLGLNEKQYMRITLAMLDAADTIVLLPGYEKSEGSKLELQYAKYHYKRLVKLVDHTATGFILEPMDEE